MLGSFARFLGLQGYGIPGDLLHRGIFSRYNLGMAKDKKTQIIIEDINNLPDPPSQKTPVILPDGRQGNMYPDGTIRGARGQFIVKPSWSAPAFTGDLAREAVKKREALRREAVVNAILDGTGAKDLSGGLKVLAQSLVSIALEGSQDRDRITAYKELMRHGGLSGDLARLQSGGSGGSSPGGLSPGAISALNYLLPVLEARARGQLGDPDPSGD